MANPDARLLLLIEDSPDDERLTRKALAATGMNSHVLVARDGAEALRVLFGDAENPETPPLVRPALILLDLKLPKVNGLEVLARIRQNPVTKQYPVVVLTSSDEESDIAECYRLGANSYIRKPVTYEEFLDAIRLLEQYWLSVNVPPRTLANRG